MIDPVTVIAQLLSPPELTATVFICAISGAVAIYAPPGYGHLVSLAILGVGSLLITLYIIVTHHDGP